VQVLSQEELYADILVVGGGIAGLIAALEARSNGANVTIVSKGKVGRSGNTLISGASVSTLISEPSFGDSFETFYSDIIDSGKGINDKKLVKVFVENSIEVINKLQKYGVTFKKINNHLFRKKPPGHSVPRFIPADYSNIPYLIRGLSITLPLLRQARKLGIKIVENTSVIKLLVSDDHVKGVVAINRRTKKVLVFYSNVVILASGGGGKIFSKSNNTRDITSDSYGLAYDAGVLLRDMEFTQFYPTMMYTPTRMSITNALFGDGAILRNSLRENFMERYDESGNMATRDVMTRAIFTEIVNGRGIDGNIFLDCRSISKNCFQREYSELYKNLLKKGVDPIKDLLYISPVYHYFIGGIVINAKGETNLSGLLACGESAGGLHGANRLAGNALSEAVIFGIITGRSAIKATKVKHNISFPSYEIEHFREGKLSAKELKIRLNQGMWHYSSVLRNMNSLEKEKKDINQILNSMGDVRINDISELMSFYELNSMLTTSVLVIEGALLRKESRGAHYRTDYPYVDNTNFKGNYYFKKVNGKLDIYFRPI